MGNGSTPSDIDAACAFVENLFATPEERALKTGALEKAQCAMLTCLCAYRRVLSGNADVVVATNLFFDKWSAFGDVHAATAALPPTAEGRKLRAKFGKAMRLLDGIL